MDSPIRHGMEIKERAKGSLKAYRRIVKFSSSFFAFAFLLPGIICLGIIGIFGGFSTLWIVDGLLLGIGITGFAGSGLLYIFLSRKIKKLNNADKGTKKTFKAIHDEQMQKLKRCWLREMEKCRNDEDRFSQISSVVDPLLADYVFNERDDKMQTFIWKDLESGEGSGEGPRAKPEQHEKIASEKLPLAAHGELTGQPSGLQQEKGMKPIK